MERNMIPLKEDCSFEILQLSDGDEDLIEKPLYSKDENESLLKAKKDFDSSDNTSFKQINYDLVNSYNRITFDNLSSLSLELVANPTTNYSMNIKEVENNEYDYPVFSSHGVTAMHPYNIEKTETNGTISLNSQTIIKNTLKEKIEKAADKPHDVFVTSTEKFSCCVVGEPYDIEEFSNYRKSESIQKEYSSYNSISDQRSETQLKKTVYEELVEDNESNEFFRRTNCNRKFFQLVDNGIQICSWLQSRPSIQRFVKRAKTSLQNFASTVELEINQILGSENPLRFSILSDETSAQAIKDAFTEVFRGNVDASTISIDLNSIPALPIGNSAGLQGAEIKIRYARQYNLVPDSTVVVSTSILLQEAVSQRWQMTTLICLDDPNFPINLHNFTATTPIPNQYVMEAERQTLPNYHLRDYGLAVDIKEAIDSVTKMTLHEPQEFLSGVSYYSTLKSAALILAGMYKKYVTK